MFSRSDSKTQTQYLPMSTPPDEFELQPNVAFLVDFLKSHVQRPLLEVRPKLKRRVLNDSAWVAGCNLQVKGFCEFLSLT